MRRHRIVLSLCLCLAAGPAGAQSFFQQPPQPQLPARPAQPQVPFPAPPRPGQPPIPGRPGQAQGQPPAAQALVRTTPAPYDRDLQRLSEILGSLHFLRGICGSNEGQKWRNEAQALIEAEAPAGERRNQMVASFNRGYRAFQQSYRTCTPAANFAIRRYLDEGAKIARDITARYAN
jgi:uncharacterized protein (TIGR02301 family)